MKVALAILRNTLGVVGPNTIDNLAHGLQKMGLEVILLTAKTPIIPSYNKIHYAPFAWSYKKLPLCLIYFIKNSRRVAKKVDILQLYLPSPFFSFVGDIISFKNKTPIVIIFESSLIENLKSVITFLKKAPFFYLSRIFINNSLLAKFTRFSCFKYVVSSRYQKNQLLSLGYPEKKVIVIPNLVDTKKYDKCDAVKIKNRFGFSNKIIIGYIGHFTHNKGVELLVKAFPYMLKKFPNSRLVLAWSELDSGKKEIKKLIKKEGLKNKSILLGKIDVPKFLSTIDVLVLPYRVTFATQLFPSVLLEAMSVGVPLVTTKIKPLTEVIADGRTALFVQPSNSQKIAKAIINLLSNQELREKMIANQREIARQKFSQEVITQKYLELYKNLQNG
jgi:glycosyltransferase involved in cell wall biosynthesis